MFYDALFAPYLLFLPPSSSPADPETGADATVDGDSYYTESAYYNVQAADDVQE